MSRPNLQAAALLCRVSTKEQEDEGYSLEAQEKLLKEHCERRGLNVVFVRTFSETASKYEQRKKFREFVNDVARNGIYHIVAEKVDRVSRSGSRDSVLIDEWLEQDANRHVHLAKQSLDIHKFAPSTAKFVWNMHLAVAKHMSDNLSEEVLKAADVMLKRGIWPTKAPIGYFRDKTHPTSPLQVDPAKATFIKVMFELYDSGEFSIPRLADKLEELGFRNANQHKVMASRIHLLLQDPFYIGQMRFRGRIWFGIHKPIIGAELFESVQKRLKRKCGGEGARRYRKHDYPLKGITQCKACAKLMSWEGHGDQVYGYCKRYGLCVRRTSRKQEDVEAELLSHLRALEVKNSSLADWIYQAIMSRDGDSTRQQARLQDELERKLKSLDQRLERLLDLRIEGDLSRDDYDRKRVECITEQERTREALSTTRADQAERIRSRAEVYKIGRTAGWLYSKSEGSAKREILHKIFETIRVSNEEVIAQYRPAYQQLAQAASLTNSSKVPETFPLNKPNFEMLRNGSVNKNDQPIRAGHPSWLAAWEEFRLSEAGSSQESDLSRNDGGLRAA
ncbi:MAG: recombinase family protein [Armatimonadetes bacterium]|nr:recombinase family protein [Armatimonadota bacterium]